MIIEAFITELENKIYCHVDAIFGDGVYTALEGEGLQYEFSKKTGRIKNFSVHNKLVVTFRTDGGLALTIYGAKKLLKKKQFSEKIVSYQLLRQSYLLVKVDHYFVGMLSGVVRTLMWVQTLQL